MTVADGAGPPRAPDTASRVTLCGHPEDRKGHCADPGCANRWQLCKDCNPPDWDG